MTSNTTMRILLLLGVLLLMPSRAVSHCDGMDGPVVKAAQQALASGNVNLVLIWVKKDNEAEVRRAFDETIAVASSAPGPRHSPIDTFLKLWSGCTARARELPTPA